MHYNEMRDTGYAIRDPRYGIRDAGISFSIGSAKLRFAPFWYDQFGIKGK